MISYIGWLDYTDTYDFYLEYVKPYVNIQKLKRRVAADDKRKDKERKKLYGMETLGKQRTSCTA